MSNYKSETNYRSEEKYDNTREDNYKTKTNNMSKEGKKEVLGTITPVITKVDGKMFESFATFIETTFNKEEIFVGCRRAVYDAHFPVVIITVETSIPVPIRKEIIFDLLRTEKPEIESALKEIISDILKVRQLFRDNRDCIIGNFRSGEEEETVHQKQVPIEGIDREAWRG